MIVLDTVRADHLSLYGYERETDPQLVAFAEGAWVFETALMPSDMTLTSHASMFTGRLVANHGVVPSSPVLGAEVTTLAEILREGGYSTYGIVSNCGWIDEGSGVAQGFQYWDTRCGRSRFDQVHIALLRARVVEMLRSRFFPERGRYAWRSAGEISDEALALVDRFGDTRPPFLLFLNYMDVHRPIHPPREYRELFPGRMDGFDMESDWTAIHRGGPERAEASAVEKAHLASQYDGALRYIDVELGRLLDGLRERGVLDEALVIITSDHGESFGSHGLFGHGSSVYQEVVHVPLVVKWPASAVGVEAGGRRITTPVSGIDLLPTIAELAGLPVPEGVDGRSLLAPADPHRGIISESAESNGLSMRSVLRGSTKLLEREEKLELYDLAADPEETTNLVAAQAALAEQLAAQLREETWREEAAEPRAPIDAAEAARLRALGYLE